MHTRRHYLLYYYKYKDSPYYSLSIFLLLMLVAFLLLMKVVLPQMYSWFSINNEVVETKKRIATINANIAYVNSLDANDIAQKRTVFVRALPYEKDIQGILSTISSSAIHSGTKLDDFSITFGDLSPKNAKSTLSSLRLTISAKGSAPTIQKFIGNLQTRLPLVDVSNLAFSNDTAQVSLSIYYKPLPVFKLNDAEPIQKISGTFDTLFTTLSEWSVNTDSPVDTVANSQSSSTQP